MSSAPIRNFWTACVLGFVMSTLIAGPTHSAPGPLDVAPYHFATLTHGRVVSLRCVGSGPQTIILESGLGGDSTGWQKLQNLLAPKYRACSYDRAGSGLSDAGPNPRDANAIVSDLSTALTSSKVNFPFLLVCHSAGALYCRRYAEEYPHKISGMILVDPSIEFQDVRFDEAFGKGAGSLRGTREKLVRCLNQATEQVGHPQNYMDSSCSAQLRRIPPGLHDRALKISNDRAAIENRISELDNLWGDTSREVAADIKSERKIPVTVLTASNTYKMVPVQFHPKIDQLWLELHWEIASGFDEAHLVTVEGSSHLIMVDQPQAIIDAINEMENQIARGKVPEREKGS